MKRRMFVTTRTASLEFHIVVEGPEGAIQFHFMSIADGDPKMRSLLAEHGQPFYSLGVEMHKRVLPTAANRISCWLLDGSPCYHDGTSLWATEVVMPAFVQGGTDGVYPLLERCYRDKFLVKDDAA